MRAGMYLVGSRSGRPEEFRRRCVGIPVGDDRLVGDCGPGLQDVHGRGNGKEEQRVMHRRLACSNAVLLIRKRSVLLLEGAAVACPGERCLAREPMGAGVLDEEGQSKKQDDRPQPEHAVL